MLCIIQIAIFKREKSHDKLVKINTRKVLIHKPNNLAVWDDGVTLTLVDWQVVGANGDDVISELGEVDAAGLRLAGIIFSWFGWFDWIFSLTDLYFNVI